MWETFLVNQRECSEFKEISTERRMQIRIVLSRGLTLASSYECIKDVWCIYSLAMATEMEMFNIKKRWKEFMNLVDRYWWMMQMQSIHEGKDIFMIGGAQSWLQYYRKPWRWISIFWVLSTSMRRGSFLVIMLTFIWILWSVIYHQQTV